MDIEFLIKKMELMAKSDYGKLEPRVEFSKISDDSTFSLVDDDLDWADSMMVDTEYDECWKARVDSGFRKITF